MRGELQTAYELGEQLLAVARSVQDAGMLSRAHMMHAETLYRLGEFAGAREHCAQGLACFDPTHRRARALLYGNDTGVGCRFFEAMSTWQLGYPDRALREGDEMLAVAKELSHPFTLVFAHYFTAVLHQLRREARAALEQIEAMLHIARERDFALYVAWGTILRGWALVQGDGREADGIDQMNQGIAACRATGGATSLPKSLAVLAAAYGKVGRAEEGLGALSDALALVNKSDERCWEAELYRLKGELLLDAGKSEAEAEACFRRAIQVARDQSARSWELRASTSLGRLLHRQGKTVEARALLQGIYGLFSEGFATADLVDARALLDALT